MSTTSSRRRETFFDRRRRAAREAREAEEAEARETSGSPGTPPTPDSACPQPHAPDGVTRRQNDSPQDDPNSPLQQVGLELTPAATAPPSTDTAAAAIAAAAALRTSLAYLAGSDDGRGAGGGGEGEREGESGGVGRGSWGDWQDSAEEEEAASTEHRLSEFRALLLEMEYNMRWDAQQATWTQCRDHWRRRVLTLSPGAETCALLSKSLLGAFVLVRLSPFPATVLFLVFIWFFWFFFFPSGFPRCQVNAKPPPQPTRGTVSETIPRRFIRVPSRTCSPFKIRPRTRVVVSRGFFLLGEK